MKQETIIAIAALLCGAFVMRDVPSYMFGRSLTLPPVIKKVALMQGELDQTVAEWLAANKETWAEKEVRMNNLVYEVEGLKVGQTYNIRAFAPEDEDPFDEYPSVARVKITNIKRGHVEYHRVEAGKIIMPVTEDIETFKKEIELYNKYGTTLLK